MMSNQFFVNLQRVFPKMSLSPGRMVGGLEEAGRAASNTAQGVKRLKIGTTEYKRCYLLPSKTRKTARKNSTLQN